ncbi:MAG: efflux RND transporter periplasmic adaptor subunit [Pantoea sp.]|uniref:efflux RND transporter periplasmic adaptor subunit n=1 Tax=Pantoea sp. TaxID=69393 RepID=UPI002391C2A8|nr:efflux RND transporter periplasmic adaptor subunit [Pantoea sp.]MDE1185470.1 efflux RND transporter periplasmic adaptor subunit [Pantoea sp.]
MYFYRLVIVLFIMSVSGCDRKSNDVEKAPLVVKTITVTQLTAPFSHSFPAKVFAGVRTPLAFKFGGKIEYLPYREGDVVKKGDVIAELNKTTLMHRIAELKSQYQTTQRQYERYSVLSKQHIISESEMDIHKHQRDSARITLKLAQSEMSDMSLKAPYDGTISQIMKKNHQVITSGDPILTMNNMDNMDVLFNVPERVMSRFHHPDKELAYDIEFSSLPGVNFPAKYKEHASTSSHNDMNWLITLTLPRPAKIVSLSGLSGRVTLRPLSTNLGENNYPVLVPVDAIFNPDSGPKGKAFVWVLNKVDGKYYVDKRAVETGTITGHCIEIKHGLSSGESVVVTGVSVLKQKQQVRVWQQEIQL